MASNGRITIPVPVMFKCGMCDRHFTGNIMTAKTKNAAKASDVKCPHCGERYKIVIRWNGAKQ